MDIVAARRADFQAGRGGLGGSTLPSDDGDARGCWSRCSFSATRRSRTVGLAPVSNKKLRPLSGPAEPRTTIK